MIVETSLFELLCVPLYIVFTFLLARIRIYYIVAFKCFSF